MLLQQQADLGQGVKSVNDIGARHSHTTPIANAVNKLIDGDNVIVLVEAKSLAEDELHDPVFGLFQGSEPVITQDDLRLGVPNEVLLGLELLDVCFAPVMTCIRAEL
jgi:hypothetical protein